MEPLEQVKQSLLQNLNCPLKDEAQNLVFGKGNPHAKIFFIGEAPGKKEDETGLPFMGRAGKILDEMLSSIDLTLEDCYIANILKYRPPKNRDPTDSEIIAHTPYLLQQITIIKPKFIVPMGRFATEFVLAEFSPDKKKRKGVPPISKIHGKLHKVTHNDETYFVFPIYHPAATIYRRSMKKDLEADVLEIGKLLKTE